MATTLNWIARQDARHRLVISLLAAGLVWFGLHGRVQPSTQSIATWDIFALCVLGLAWLTIITTPPNKCRLRAQMQDVSRTVIFVFVVMAACAVCLRWASFFSPTKAPCNVLTSFSIF